MKRGALFLDRDGTLIEHVHYLHDPAQVRLASAMSTLLANARARGYLLFLFTNQSGVGRGYFSLAEAQACNDRMIELIGLGAEIFDGICIAAEAPDQPSRYRKPKPDYILEMIAAHDLDPDRCVIIGDTASDWKAGLNAGIRALAVLSNLTTSESEAEREVLGRGSRAG